MAGSPLSQGMARALRKRNAGASRRFGNAMARSDRSDAWPAGRAAPLGVRAWLPSEADVRSSFCSADGDWSGTGPPRGRTGRGGALHVWSDSLVGSVRRRNAFFAHDAGVGVPTGDLAVAESGARIRASLWTRAGAARVDGRDVIAWGHAAWGCAYGTGNARSPERCCRRRRVVGHGRTLVADERRRSATVRGGSRDEVGADGARPLRTPDAPRRAYAAGGGQVRDPPH